MLKSFLPRAALRSVRTADWLVDFLLLAAVVLMGLVGAYALWDANLLYAPAKAEQFETYKPAESTEGYDELRAINPEVFGWVTLYGTGIDYPLLQSEDNDKYVHTDAKGKYSLTGSLFLDWRNDPAFGDFNSIIYGHNMAEDAMFGGLDKFLDEDYFTSHPYGTLFYGGQTFGLEVFAFFAADAYDRDVYDPALESEADKSALLERIRELAIHFQDLNLTIDDRIVLFSTCTSYMTNGRYLLALRITEQVPEDPFYEEPKPVEKIKIKTELLEGQYRQVPYWVWYAMLALVIFLVLVLVVTIICRIIGWLRRVGRKERAFHGRKALE